jgi:hypothetical protein
VRPSCTPIRSRPERVQRRHRHALHAVVLHAVALHVVALHSPSYCWTRARLGLAASQVPPRPSLPRYCRARPRCPLCESVPSRHTSPSIRARPNRARPWPASRCCSRVRIHPARHCSFRAVRLRSGPSPALARLHRLHRTRHCPALLAPTHAVALPNRAVQPLLLALRLFLVQRALCSSLCASAATVLAAQRLLPRAATVRTCPGPAPHCLQLRRAVRVRQRRATTAPSHGRPSRTSSRALPPCSGARSHAAATSTCASSHPPSPGCAAPAAARAPSRPRRLACTPPLAPAARALLRRPAPARLLRSRRAPVPRAFPASCTPPVPPEPGGGGEREMDKDWRPRDKRQRLKQKEAPGIRKQRRRGKEIS